MELGKIEFPKCCVFQFLEYWTMDKVQKPSNSECYTPSSEPLKIHSFSVKKGKWVNQYCNVGILYNMNTNSWCIFVLWIENAWTRPTQVKKNNNFSLKTPKNPTNNILQDYNGHFLLSMNCEQLSYKTSSYTSQQFTYCKGFYQIDFFLFCL
jgi:hypothetical protein